MPPKALFEDKEFPARWTSLANPHASVSWKRPHEITQKPMLFVDGSSRFDINQGELGDCWFLAACAAVAEHPNLMKKIVPEGQVLYGPRYDGSLRFRFWNLGTWEEVKIDDRLPVNEKNIPVYAHCKAENEFWMPLLEKAFARLYGNYAYLEGGFCCEGLMKLTGLSVEYLAFKNWTYDEDFQKIKNGLDNNGVIVVGVLRPQDGPGIPAAHAYTVNKTFYLSKGDNNGEELRLVRVRNPWGNEVEWTGAWSDGDDNWNKLSEHVRDLLKYIPGEDGEYWMDIKDFVKYITDGAVLRDKPQNCLNMNIVQLLKCHWDDGNTGGFPDDPEEFAKNPQYLMMLKEKENLISGRFSSKDCQDEVNKIEAYVEIITEDNRRKFPSLGLGFFVFEVADAQKKLSADELLAARAVTGVNFKPSVGVGGHVSLEPGRRYVVVVAHASEISENFLVRIYSHYRIISLQQLTD